MPVQLSPDIKVSAGVTDNAPDSSNQYKQTGGRNLHGLLQKEWVGNIETLCGLCHPGVTELKFHLRVM